MRIALVTDAWRPQDDYSKRRESPAGEGAEGSRFLYVGRMAEEKSIAAFLDADLPGSRQVVGGGPLWRR